MNRPFLFLIACVFGCCLFSCSANFNQQWKQAVATKPAADITGPWLGYWHSDANGHQGELRSIVTVLDEKTGACRFQYHATFMKFLSGGYAVTHLVQRTKDGFTFSGDQPLTGLGGGLYHYEGKATPQEFHATYRSEGDHGVFEMKRP